jgi:hypothetical protein
MIQRLASAAERKNPRPRSTTGRGASPDIALKGVLHFSKYLRSKFVLLENEGIMFDVIQGTGRLGSMI